MATVRTSSVNNTGIFLSMTLKVILLDVEEQVCFDTGIELDYDFEMLYISTVEDVPMFEGSKYSKRVQNRLIIQDLNGKLKVDDADDTEGIDDSPGGE